MKDLFTIMVLKSFFGMEILNNYNFGENEILIELGDGTKARIIAKITE